MGDLSIRALKIHKYSEGNDSFAQARIISLPYVRFFNTIWV
ncbi:hypothetical protein SXCC_01600 [Gluconacetobacter sp. SXCC-1]|nr:hypothetical protein SXCC_01600 [Gluconacetobacter sp. SXCC-1]